MAYICNKGVKCSLCPHYRYDEDYGDNTCHAQIDEDKEKSNEENNNSGN